MPCIERGCPQQDDWSNPHEHAEALSVSAHRPYAKSPPPYFLDTLVRRYDRLAKVLHIPVIDQELYETLLLAPLRKYLRKRAERQDKDDMSDRAGYNTDVDVCHDAHLGPLIGGLDHLIDTLQLHEERTVKILRLNDARDELVEAIIDCCSRQEAGECTTEDAQQVFLLFIQELQLVTLELVEAVLLWRDQLSRPYPFRVNGGENCLIRIIEDCVPLARCDLCRTLPLRLDQYPCCSNADLQRLAKRKEMLRRIRLLNSRAVLESGLDAPARLLPPSRRAPLENRTRAVPLSWWNIQLATIANTSAALRDGEPQRKSTGYADRLIHGPPRAANSVANRKFRLLAAEGLIKREGDTEAALMKELWQRAQKDNCFVPLLWTPDLFTLSEDGTVRDAISLDPQSWRDLLNTSYCADLARRRSSLLNKNRLPRPLQNALTRRGREDNTYLHNHSEFGSGGPLSSPPSSAELPETALSTQKPRRSSLTLPRTSPYSNASSLIVTTDGPCHKATSHSASSSSTGRSTRSEDRRAVPATRRGRLSLSETSSSTSRHRLSDSDSSLSSSAASSRPVLPTKKHLSKEEELEELRRTLIEEVCRPANNSFQHDASESGTSSLSSKSEASSSSDKSVAEADGYSLDTFESSDE